MADFTAAYVAVASLKVVSTTTSSVAEGMLRLTMVPSPAVELLAVVLVLLSGAAIATIFFDALHFNERLFMINYISLMRRSQFWKCSRVQNWKNEG